MCLTKKELKLNDRIIVSGKDLVANVVYEAIKCKSHPTLPRNIETIVDKITDLYKDNFNKVSDDYYYKEFKNYIDLENWIDVSIMTIPEIKELNLTQNEFENGVEVDDSNRDEFVFISRNSPAPDVKDDFVDLGAFSRNLVHNLIREEIEIDYSSFAS